MEVKKMKNAEKKSVSSLLDKAFGKLILFGGGERGKILHETNLKFLYDIFKTADRNRKINFRIFSQRITKIYNNILSELRKYNTENLYYEDVKLFLRAKQKEITKTAKILARENYYIIIPEQVELACFGGIIELEAEILGKINGILIPARADLKIETSELSFKIRDFKSCELNNDDNPRDPQSALYRHF